VRLKLTQLGKGPVKSYYTESDTTTTSTVRQTTQGEITGFFQANDATNTTGGELLIVYTMKLKDRTSDYGFTLQVRDREMARAMLEAYLKLEDGRFRDFFKDSKEIKHEKDLSPDQKDRWFSRRNVWLKSRGRLFRDYYDFVGMPTIGNNPLLAYTAVCDANGVPCYDTRYYTAGTVTPLLSMSMVASGTGVGGTFAQLADGGSGLGIVKTWIHGNGGGTIGLVGANCSTYGSIQTTVATAATSGTTSVGAQMSTREMYAKAAGKSDSEDDSVVVVGQRVLINKLVDDDAVPAGAASPSKKRARSEPRTAVSKSSGPGKT